MFLYCLRHSASTYLTSRSAIIWTNDKNILIQRVLYPDILTRNRWNWRMKALVINNNMSLILYPHQCDLMFNLICKFLFCFSSSTSSVWVECSEGGWKWKYLPLLALFHFGIFIWNFFYHENLFVRHHSLKDCIIIK